MTAAGSTSSEAVIDDLIEVFTLGRVLQRALADPVNFGVVLAATGQFRVEATVVLEPGEAVVLGKVLDR